MQARSSEATDAEHLIWCALPPDPTENPNAALVRAAVGRLQAYSEHLIDGSGIAHGLGFDIDEEALIRDAMKSLPKLVTTCARLRARPTLLCGPAASPLVSRS